MHEFLWLELNWHPILLLITVIFSIILMKYAFKVAGLLVLSLVLYQGVNWDMWSWVSWLFWIVWFAGLIFVVTVAVANGGVKLARLCAGLAIAIVATAFVFNSIAAFADWLNEDDRPSATATDSSDSDTTETDTEDPAKCAETWRMKRDTPDNGDLVEDVPSIREANTRAEAQAAAADWAELVGRHPETLKAATSIILDKLVQAQVLVDEEGCATRAAEKLVQELKIELSLSDITPAQAPSTGYNTFTDTQSGEVYAKHGRITGDRKAVEIVLRNGKTVWVMARCGNPVTKTPPPVDVRNPPGNPPSNPPQGCPPGTVPYQGRCIKEESDDGTGGNDSPASQPVDENPSGPTDGATEEPPKPNDGPEPEDNSSAPDPVDGGYDSGSSDGSGTPGGSTCNDDGCEGGGSTPAQGEPEDEDDGTHEGDPGGFD